MYFCISMKLSMLLRDLKFKNDGLALGEVDCKMRGDYQEWSAVFFAFGAV
jgi:hypothetical protein